MRKLFYYFTSYFWAWVVLLVFIVSFTVIITGCASLSLKAPTTQMLIRAATFTAGYEVGRAVPKHIAEELIHFTQVDREDILTLYPSWRRYLLYRVKDPAHRRLIAGMLELVDIELKFKPTKEQEEIIRRLFREFIAGVEEGINAN